MNSSQTKDRKGFTLIELMVAVGILVILIGSVGLIFRSASNSVGVSQSVMDLLSTSSAIQEQMDSDVAGLNRNGFLVIRSTTYNYPSAAYPSRCDQISFLATGNFPHRTGTTAGITVAPGPMIDPVVSTNALIWWGQLAICQPTGLRSAENDPETYLPSDETYHVPLDQVPTGQSEGDFILGRNAILLFPVTSDPTSSPLSGRTVNQGGTTVGSYVNYPPSSPTMPGFDYAIGNANANNPNNSEGESADMTQSRVDAASTFPEQIMAFLRGSVVARTPATARFEADHYCYRLAALRSPYDTEMNSSGAVSTTGTRNFVNGYFRTHCVALQGVSSFSIDWTDGSLYSANTEIDVRTNAPIGDNLIGTTRWYGYHNAQCGNNADGIVDPVGMALPYTLPMPTITAGSSPDKYTAIFSFDNKSRWPVALRFRYHIADPTGRLASGRDVVQVIKLPS